MWAHSMLTDTKARQAKPRAESYRLADSGGLFLFVTPAGGKYWRWRHRRGGREQTLSLGSYPDMSLAEARAARDEARRQIKAGPMQPEAKPAPPFEQIARDWHALQSPRWTPIHAADVLHSMERDAFPGIGHMPVDSIDPRQVLDTLRAVEARGAVETAHRLRQRLSAVFGYAMAQGICNSDPAAQVQRAMAPVSRKGRQPAVTTLEQARQVIARVDAQHAHPVTKLAHRLLAMTALRPGVIITAPWAELQQITAEDPVWTIPAARMKLALERKSDEANDHQIPLTPQMLETIAALRSLSGRTPWLCPNNRHAHKPMSANAIGYLLNRTGYHGRHVPHGWRATFFTVLVEADPAARQIIDLALAHVPKDKVEAAYNRATHMARRRALYETWCNMLMDGQMPVADLLTMPRK